MTLKPLMLALATSAALAAAIPTAVQAAPCTLTGLSWMAASWLNADDPKGAQERWAVAPGGVLMGSSFEFPKGKAGYAEIMTVKPDDGGLSMILRHFDGGLSRAWEERGAPMTFKAADCERASATFDGQGDHVGEHMTYSRKGDRLLIVADFLHGGKPDHEEWRMVRGPQ